MVHTTSGPSSSSNLSPSIANTSYAPDLAADDINPTLHDQPMIEPFNRG